MRRRLTGGMARWSAMLAATTVAAVTAVAAAAPVSPSSLTVLPDAHGCLFSVGGVSEGGRCSRGRGFAQPSSLAIASDGRQVYVVGVRGLAVLDRDLRTGRLRQARDRTGCVADAGADAEGAGCTPARLFGGPIAVALSPDGMSAYVTTTNALVTFDRDPATGRLRQKAGPAGCVAASDTGGVCSRAPILHNDLRPVVSPDSRNVYLGAGQIFDRAADGSLTPRPGPAGARGGKLTLSPDGRHAYTTESARTVGVYDRAPDGSLEVRGVSVLRHSAFFPLVFSPDGRFAYALSNDRTGQVMVSERRSDGTLRALTGPRGCVSAAGSRGRCGVAGPALSPLAIAITPDGRSAYVTGYLDGGIVVFDRDVNTGALRRVAGRSGCISDRSPACLRSPGNNTRAVVVSPDGTSVHVVAQFGDAVVSFPRAQATPTAVTVPQRAPDPPGFVPPPAPAPGAFPPADAAVVQRFAQATVAGEAETVDSGRARSAVRKRYRALLGCFRDWATAPEYRQDIVTFYELSLAGGVATANDVAARGSVARLRAVDGLARLPELTAVVDGLERERAAIRAVADATARTCTLVKQWRRRGWRRSQTPMGVRELQKRIRESARAGDRRVHERAAALVRLRGGAAAIKAAAVIERRLTYPEAYNAECDAIALELGPENVECS